MVSTATSVIRYRFSYVRVDYRVSAVSQCNEPPRCFRMSRSPSVESIRHADTAAGNQTRTSDLAVALISSYVPPSRCELETILENACTQEGHQNVIVRDARNFIDLG